MLDTWGDMKAKFIPNSGKLTYRQIHGALHELMAIQKAISGKEYDLDGSRSYMVMAGVDIMLWLLKDIKNLSNIRRQSSWTKALIAIIGMTI